MYTIYGKKTHLCKWCGMAKNLLEEIDVDYEFIDIEENEEDKTFIKSKGFTTVPAIFYDGEKVGGYEELVEFVKI